MLSFRSCLPPMCVTAAQCVSPTHLHLLLPRAVSEDPFAPSSSTKGSCGSTGGTVSGMAASFRQQLEGFRSEPADTKVGWRLLW